MCAVGRAPPRRVQPLDRPQPRWAPGQRREHELHRLPWPERGAMEFISPTNPADPTVNPSIVDPRQALASSSSLGARPSNSKHPLWKSAEPDAPTSHHWRMPVRHCRRPARGCGAVDIFRVRRACRTATPGSTRPPRRSIIAEKLGAVCSRAPCRLARGLLLVPWAIIFGRTSSLRTAAGHVVLAPAGPENYAQRTRPEYLPAFANSPVTRRSRRFLASRARLPDRLRISPDGGRARSSCASSVILPFRRATSIRTYPESPARNVVLNGSSRRSAHDEPAHPPEAPVPHRAAVRRALGRTVGQITARRIHVACAAPSSPRRPAPPQA